MIVDEWCSRISAGIEAQQTRAASALFPLVDVARENLLLDTFRIAFGCRPTGLHVQALEFEMGLVHRHVVLIEVRKAQDGIGVANFALSDRVFKLEFEALGWPDAAVN